MKTPQKRCLGQFTEVHVSAIGHTSEGTPPQLSRTLYRQHNSIKTPTAHGSKDWEPNWVMSEIKTSNILCQYFRKMARLLLFCLSSPLRPSIINGAHCFIVAGSSVYSIPQTDIMTEANQSH